jgi:tRNA A-37 threonylcarbamoyl transferase component Bud32
MAYCHECGEKVAENDVFCPYCGISLQPIAVGEDISQEQTIFVSQPPLSEPTESAENANNQPDDFSGSVTEDSFDVKTDSSDIPAEMSENKEVPLDAPSDAAESFAANQSTPDANNEISKPEFLQESENSPQIPLPENIEILKPLEETPTIEEPFDSVNQAEQSEEVKAEAIDSTNEEIPSQPSDFVAEDESISIEEPTFSSSNPTSTESDSGEDQTLLSSDSISKEKYLPELNEEIEPQESPDEKAIAKPEIELEIPEKPSSQPVYDSVQIVQREEIREPVAEAEPAELQPIEAEQAPSNQVEQKPEEKEGRSFTTPNFTGSNTDGKSQSKLKPLDEGTVLNNRYEIVRKIGGGGMGAVYLASDKNLGGVLRAVKEMVQSYIEETQQEKAVADFKRESMLLTSLEHQAIPTIFDYFYDEREQRFYLVMKYISGGDLSSRLRSAPEGRVDEKTVTEWGIQVADVLDYLHNRQPPIVYRDLKPANIMIDGNSGRLMLIDFGIARWVNKEEKGVTAVGTMGYAPPELFSGNVEARSDIYSLGSTMFHLLTGADPQSNPLLIFDFQKNPRPRQINPQLSDQIERILMRSVEYNSDKRFASAAEMRDALQEHLDNLKASRVTFGVKEAPASVALSDQPVFCGFCGQKIVATDMFCAFCGAKQPIAAQGVHMGGGYSAPNLTAKLTILGTNDLESPSFYLEKDENLVGRRDPMSNIFPEIDLSKFDPQTKISRRHARIWREGANFMVEDLGSSNGTVLLPTVNETVRLLPHQPHVLTNGDKLKVGDTTMHFVIG